MAFRRFDADELKTFLRAVDRELDRRTTILVIGGSALALGYAVPTATNDIDTFHSMDAELQRAAARARDVAGLDIVVADSQIAQFPTGYEQRLVRALDELEHLEIYVLERHDLAASKLLRGDRHDRQQLARLHEVEPLDLTILNARIDDLLVDVHGANAEREARWARYHFVYELWGELEAEDVRPPG